MQLLWNTLVICCTGFVIVIVSDGLLLRLFDEQYLFFVLLQIIRSDEGATTLIKSISFYIAITLEVFILCFAGEFLGAKVCEGILRISKALIAVIYPSVITFYTEKNFL